MESKYKIIYSMKIMQQLVENGYFPVQTLPNPKNTEYNCWVFETSEQLQNLIDEIMQKG